MSKGVRWTKAEFDMHTASNGTSKAARRAQAAAGAAGGTGTNVGQVLKADAALKRYQAIGRLPKNAMNKTETAYAALLNERIVRGEVLEWRFHPINVRLANNTFYEIDFMVLTSALALEIHEVKGGYTNPVGQLKIKLCAEALPFFRMLKCSRQAKKDGGGWTIEEF